MTQKDKIQKLAEMIENLGKIQPMPVINIPSVAASPAVETSSTADQMKAYRAFVESLNVNTEYFVYGEQILREFINQQTTVEEETVEEETLEETTTLFKILAKPGQRMPKKRDASKPGQILKTPEYLNGGKSLLQYLHRFEKLSDTTEWDFIGKGDRLQNQEFKNNPDNVLIIVGKFGVAYAKPDEKYILDKTEQAAQRGKEYDAKGDTNLRYRVVAFSKDMRVDNMLIPDEYETEDTVDPKTGKVTSKIKKDPDTGKPIVKVDRSAERRRGKLSDNAPATSYNMKRVGIPDKYDSQNRENFFDLLRGAIGAIQKVYVGSSRLMKSREFEPSQWTHKEFKPEQIPGPVKKFVFNPETGKHDKEVVIKSISAPKKDVPGAVRSPGGVARDVVTGRAQERARPATSEVIQALHPALDKLLPKAIDKLQAEMSAAEAAGKGEDAARMSRTAGDLKDALAALHDPSPDYSNEALTDLGRVIEKTVAGYVDPKDEEAVNSTLKNLARRQGLPQFWRGFMNNLTNPDMWI